MSMLDKHLDFVKVQIKFHLGCADQYSGDTYRSKKHLETAGSFEALLQDLEAANASIDSKVVPIRSARKPRLSLAPDDLEDLPEELIEELSISSGDKTEFAIIRLLEEADSSIISLDQLLVGLYRKTGEIHKRQTTTSRLYRMSQKGLISNVPGRKGVYSLLPMSEREIDRLLTAEGEGQPELK